MKTVMLANMVIMSVYAICVTCVATYFDNPKLLWWYLLLGVIEFTYKSKEEQKTEAKKLPKEDAGDE